SCLSFGSAAAAGTFIFNQENGAVLTMSTGSVLLTQQQSAELVILKQRPSGKVEELDFSEVNWSYSNEGVARVEGKNIVGLNEGSTILHGKYRNKEIRLDVQVAQPLDGQVEVSLHYLDGAQVSVAAGDGERDWLDGSLLESSLVAPESIIFSANGNAAFSDSGLLRVIENDAVTSVELEDFYLSPKLVRYDNDELYMLTHEWEDEDGISYGIFR